MSTDPEEIIDATRLPFTLTRSICNMRDWPAHVVSGAKVQISHHVLSVTPPSPGTALVWKQIYWMVPPSNFDNIFRAMITLFEISSLEGWVATMYNAIDGSENQFQQPVRQDSPSAMAVFFLVFIIVASFFLLNLFVSVLLSQYYLVMQKNGTILKTPHQRAWVVVSKNIGKTSPPDPSTFVPEGAIRARVFLVLRNKYFEVAMAFIIILNTLFMATEHYPQSSGYSAVLDVANILFTTIYCIEALLKIYAIGWTFYWLDLWNRFDLFVCLVSAAGIVIDHISTGNSPGSAVSAIRILRIARVLRVLRFYKGLQTLMGTLISSLPDFLNVSGLVFLVFFIYAVTGIRLFFNVKYGDFITNYANWERIDNALITLFRMSTGENWQGLMADVGRPPCSRFDISNPQLGCDQHHCDPLLGQCVHWILPYVYFISFVLVVMFVFVNLFIAVVVENYETLTTSADLRINEEHISKYTSEWLAIGGAEMTLRYATDMKQFFYSIGRPLGLEENLEDDDELYNPYNKLRLLSQIEQCEHQYKVHFQAVLVSLVEDYLAGPIPRQVRRKVDRQASSLLKRFKIRKDLHSRARKNVNNNSGSSYGGLTEPLVEK
eukprot:NODE_57_length_2832_cov_71.348904_g53_i0.p1 GENE.NODE_57_length_2832_cov_71.348904_g53_i0~~NODE_57_length_2832_cov_71.348904_g53_i0.p1  ORF type:complete len:605 (-),score=169.36 NODE_57_length_2832_cov_71.348904_g53_i0:52-1866(-)